MESEVYLDKHLGAFEVFTVSSGTMIGAGIFLLPGMISARAGPASLLCFLIAGLISCCAALSVCELATAMPKAGGSYFFISRSMGAMFGSIVGWGSLLGLAFKGAFAFVGAGDYFRALVAVSPILVAVVACLLLLAVNLVGTRVTGSIQNMLVVVLAVMFGLFIGVGLFSVKWVNLQPFFTGSLSAFLEATGMVFITYLGLIKVTAIAEEVKDPDRNLPLGIIGSVVFVTVLYMLVMLIIEGIFPVVFLTGKVAPIADAAEFLAGRTGLVLAVICGLMATLSTGNAALLSSSRYPFAMARDNLMPEEFLKINSVTGTPVLSISIVGASIIALIVFVNTEAIAKLGSVFNIVVFAMINLAVIILRRAKPEWYKPGFRSPLYPWLQVVGIVGSVGLIPFMGLPSSIAAIVLVLAGLAWYRLYGRGRALPEYGMRDAIRTLREKKAAELAIETSQPRRSWRLLVPLWFVQVPVELLLIASYIAMYFEERVHLVICEDMPEQTPLRAVEEYPTECRELEGCLLPLDPRVRPHFEMDKLYSCSRERAFVEIARQRESDLALMEWPPDTTRLIGEMRYFVREMPCDLAFLVSRAMPSIGRILVASAKPGDDLKMRIAGAIAARTGATITVLRVYPSKTREMDEGDIEKQIQDAGVRFGIPLKAEMVRADDVPGAIAETSIGFDLLVIGSAAEARWIKTPFGEMVESIIDSVDCSVLVTRPVGAEKAGAWKRLVKRLVRAP